MRTCDDAVPRVNNAWASAQTAPSTQLETSATCPAGTPDPYGDLSDGLAVVDVRKALGAAPDGAYAEWRFAAPAGTSIRSLAVTRDIGNRDEWTPYGRIGGVDQVGESCMPGMGQAFCRIEGRRVFSGLDATSVAYGIRCVTAPYCAHGATLRTVWALVLGATVTLEDLEPPVVGAPEPVGLADGRWHNGAGLVTFSATDNTGVRRRRLVEGGVERGTWTALGAAAGGCGELSSGLAYTYAQPCAGSRGLNGVQAMAAQPCGWGDGVHHVRAAATDTGGTERLSATSATVRVDCTPPDVAVQAASSAPAGATVHAAVAVEDPHAGVAQTDVQWSVDGGAYRDGDHVVLQAGRTYRFRARATDHAGNLSTWAASGAIVGAPGAEGEGSPALTPAEPLVPGIDTAPLALLADDEDHDGAAAPTHPRAAPPEPPAAAQPRVRITRRTIEHRVLRLRGTSSSTGRVAVRAVLRIGKRRRVYRRRATATATATAATGRWHARIRLPRRGRVRIVTITAG